MYTIENVEKAVQEFYFSLTSREEAHQWLTGFQQSLSAWDIGWKLLRSNQPEIQFFGATTLQNKISKHWQELPVEQLENLKEKIFENILKFCSGPKIVLTRLCILLSSYVLHTIDNSWKTAIGDIIHIFRPDNFPSYSAADVIGVVVETLTVLPEEFHSFVLPSFNRGLVRHALENSAINVLKAVENVLSNQYSETLRLQALKCFSSWVQFGIPLPEYETIIPLIMMSTYDELLLDASLDCLTNVCCHPDAYRYPESLQKLFGHLLHLELILNRYLFEKDFDKCYSIYSLFTTVGETQCKMLVENVLKDTQRREVTMRFMGIILQCSACPGQFPLDENCSGLPFNFWYMLQDELYCSEAEDVDVYRTYFVPIYFDLVDILIIKSIVPTDQEQQSWSLDDRETFRCYRQDIGDTLMYCYNILRDPMLKKLFGHVDYLTGKLTAGDVSCIKMLEATLYAFESVAESVDLDENVYLPFLFSYLPNISRSNVKVANTTLNMIGAYAGWIRYHPNTLIYVMNVLTFGLANSELVVSATRTLKEISRDCQLNMIPYASQILTESKGLIANVNVHSSEKIRLMSTVGRLLSTMNLSDVLSYLNELLVPYIQQLEGLSHGEHTVTKQATLLVILNMLAVLSANLDTKAPVEDIEDDMQAQCLNRPQPLVTVLQQLMPIIHQVAVMWNNDSLVIEAICDILKKSLSTLMDDTLPIIGVILNLITTLYEQTPRVCIIDLVKQLLLLFGSEGDRTNDLRQVLAVIVNVTLLTLERNFSEHTDLAQGFLQTMAQVLKKTTMLQHPDFNLISIFQCGVIALSLPENYTVKSASIFLVSFINQSVEGTQSSGDHRVSAQAMVDIVNNYGDSLLEVCMKCVGGDAPRGVMDHISDIFLAINKNYFSKLCQWMNTLLQRDKFPSPKITPTQREHYTRQILKERVNKRKLQEVIKEYSLACRGLIGTEYGAQTMQYL